MNVSAEEWDNLPEVTDIGHKFKRKKLEKFTPVPDSVLSSAASTHGQVL